MNDKPARIPPLLLHPEGYYFREMASADAIPIWEINSDGETRKYTRLLRQQSPEDIASWLAYYPHYNRHGYGIWAIIDPNGGTLAGLCGLRVRKDMQEKTDISYRIHPHYRRRGIASAAVKSCTLYAQHILMLPELLAQIHTNNAISCRIAENQGFRCTGQEDVWKNYILTFPVSQTEN
ncbi:MAG: GNAT family N-acetyltransferase [Bacteroidetes bacterium]|nr:GNAT family N-acetyltransferase [Bacteroidota bacterium]